MKSGSQPLFFKYEINSSSSLNFAGKLCTFRLRKSCSFFLFKFDDEEVEVVRTGTPRGCKGLPLEEEDPCSVGLVGESEDEGRGVRDPLFIFGIAVDAEALLNGGL